MKSFFKIGLLTALALALLLAAGVIMTIPLGRMKS